MVTPLDRPLKREILIDGEPYIVTIDPVGLRVTRKGRRKGHEVAWQDVLSGEVTLRSQLTRSLAGSQREKPQGGGRTGDDDDEGP